MDETSQQGPCLRIADLPDILRSDITFPDTSFFKQNDGSPPPELPTPSGILSHSGNISTGVVKLEHLNLAVKFGPFEWVELEEAQAMRAIRHAFPHGEVPVPEVFGWKRHGARNFIYMSLVRGQTLREAWPSLTTADKRAICGELKDIVTALRRCTHDIPQEVMIGSVNGGVMQDRFFKPEYQKGPFSSTRSFNDWLLAVATRQTPGPEDPIDTNEPYRQFIPDESKVVLTHGDLSLGNIIISDGKVAGIIDWEQAGWYPEYWEYYKICWGVSYLHEFREAGWADLVMTPLDDDVCDAVAAYFSWRQP